jgi:glycosyltransferase involved in cell wall biosynthesis
MPKLVTALLVRNEADKYLTRVLLRCKEFSSEVVVLDDGSTDETPDLAKRLGCTVYQRGAMTPMWGHEAPARAELWELGRQHAMDGWLLICDADMILHGDPVPLTLSTSCTAWAWCLYDLWDDEKYYRRDGHWVGHLHPRPWMFRPSALQSAPEWPERGLHVGHCPRNFPLVVGRLTPDSGVYWSHLSYLTKNQRSAKLAQYESQAHQLTPWELDHARSVGD